MTQPEREALSPQESAKEWADELALQIAAQQWCHKDTSDIEMDSRLAQMFASTLSGWLQSYAQAERNTQFYRGIVCEIGEMVGDAAKTSDDGSLQDSVLALKVPELVRRALSPPTPASGEPTDEREARVTEQMITAYLEANDAYWKRTDEMPTPPHKWRTGTTREATRESLEAALAPQTSSQELRGALEAMLRYFTIASTNDPVTLRARAALSHSDAGEPAPRATSCEHGMPLWCVCADCAAIVKARAGEPAQPPAEPMPKTPLPGKYSVDPYYISPEEESALEDEAHASLTAVVQQKGEGLTGDALVDLLREKLSDARKTGVWHGFWAALNADRIEMLLNALDPAEPTDDALLDLIDDLRDGYHGEDMDALPTTKETAAADALQAFRAFRLLVQRELKDHSGPVADRLRAALASPSPSAPEGQSQADTARLDWLQAQWTNGVHAEVCGKGDGTTWHAMRPAASVFAGPLTFHGSTLREAIDEARRSPTT